MARVHGPSTQAVNSGSGNRPLDRTKDVGEGRGVEGKYIPRGVQFHCRTKKLSLRSLKVSTVCLQFLKVETLTLVRY